MLPADMAAAPSFIPATIGLTGIPATSVGQTGNIATIAGHTTTDGIETNDEAMSIATTETINVIVGTRPTIALTTRLATARVTTPTVVSQPNGSPATFSAAKLRIVLSRTARAAESGIGVARVRRGKRRESYRRRLHIERREFQLC